MAKKKTWFTTPNAPALEISPGDDGDKGLGPPEVGTSLTNGARTAPARPKSPEPQMNIAK